MHKIAVATMRNYSTHVFTSVNRVECHAHGCSTCGITRDVSIPHYRKRGPCKHVMRFALPMSCYHAFPRVEK